MTRKQSDSTSIVYNSQQLQRGIEKLASSILETHPEPRDLCLLGVHSGGDTLVRKVESAMTRLAGIEDLNLLKGLVEISFYRDDWTRLSQVPTLCATDIPFDIDGRTLILVDDVLFTGRTIRAALEAIFSQGRPAKVELAVLVDRGHREFPIQPDHVGLYLPTERHQSVNLYLFKESDKDHALLENNKYKTLKAS